MTWLNMKSSEQHPETVVLNEMEDTVTYTIGFMLTQDLTSIFYLIYLGIYLYTNKKMIELKYSY